MKIKLSNQSTPPIDVLCGKRRSTLPLKILLMLFVFIFTTEISFAQTNTVNLTVPIGSTFRLDPAPDFGLYYIYNSNTLPKFSTSSAFTAVAIQSVSNLGSPYSYYVFDVTALALGVYTATINVSYKEYAGSSMTTSKTLTYVINVTEVPIVKSISIPLSLTLNLGDEYTITPVVIDSNAETTLTWNSTNPSVATVTEGKIIANGIGSAIISCTASNGVSAQCSVEIKGIPAAKLEIDPEELELIIHTNTKLSVKFTPSNTTDQRVEWVSSDNNVALVTSDGLVIGVGEGYCHITATTLDGGNLSATSVIHVVPPFVAVESIILPSKSCEMVIGDELTLTPTFDPPTATNKVVTWSSSNPYIATVDKYGRIVANDVGKTEIIATTTDGTELSTNCIITVKAPDQSEYENVVYTTNTNGVAGSNINLPIYLKNSSAITAVQFDLVLPEPLTLISNNGITFNTVSDRLDASTHQLSVSPQNDGSIRVICHSTTNISIFGNEGAILDLNLLIADNIDAGAYDIIIRNIVLSTPEGTKFEIPVISNEIRIVNALPGDADGDGIIDVADIVVVVNYIMGKENLSIVVEAADYDTDGIVDVADIVGIINLIMQGNAFQKVAMRAPVMSRGTRTECSLEVAPFTLESGNTTKVVSLNMYNPDIEFTAVECDLVLPEGIDIATNRKGNPIINMNTQDDRNDGTHTVSCANKGNGLYHIACYSTQNDTFYDEEGAIIDVTLAISSGIQPGFYKIAVENVKLVEVSGKKTQPENPFYSSILVDNGGSVINATLYGTYEPDIINDFSDALSLNSDICSIDISNAVGFENAAKISTQNPNTLYIINENQNLNSDENVIVCRDSGNTSPLIKIYDGSPFNSTCDFSADVIIYERNFKSDKWQALYLPYDLEYEEWCKYGKVAQFVGVEGTVDTPVLVWSSINSGSLSANVPYIFKPFEASQIEFTDTNRSVSESPEEGTAGMGYSINGLTYTLLGNFLQKNDMYSTHAYALSDGNFHPAKSDDVVLNPLRVFIVTSSANKAPQRIGLRIDDENINSIENLMVDEKNNGDSYFDVLGRSVSVTTKGFYIKDGQKMIINNY